MLKIKKLEKYLTARLKGVIKSMEDFEDKLVKNPDSVRLPKQIWYHEGQRGILITVSTIIHSKKTGEK